MEKITINFRATSTSNRYHSFIFDSLATSFYCCWISDSVDRHRSMHLPLQNGQTFDYMKLKLNNYLNVMNDDYYLGTMANYITKKKHRAVRCWLWLTINRKMQIVGTMNDSWPHAYFININCGERTLGKRGTASNRIFTPYHFVCQPMARLNRPNWNERTFQMSPIEAKRQRKKKQTKRK